MLCPNPNCTRCYALRAFTKLSNSLKLTIIPMLQLSNAYFSPSFRRITLTKYLFFAVRATLAKPSPSDVSSRRHHAIAAAKMYAVRMYVCLDETVKEKVRGVLDGVRANCPELKRDIVYDELRVIHKRTAPKRLLAAPTVAERGPERRLGSGGSFGTSSDP